MRLSGLIRLRIVEFSYTQAALLLHQKRVQRDYIFIQYTMQPKMCPLLFAKNISKSESHQ